jgi:hypothetical protein
MAFFAEHWSWTVDAVLAVPVSRRFRLVERKLEALRKEQAEIDAIKSRGRR